jgi:predicted alpha-1,6-mannanase (GH76 family)
MKIRHALTAICAAAVLALTACTSAGSSDNPATTTVTETTDAAPDSEDMTQTVVDLSWAQQTEADKNAMCDGLALFGTEWGADQMRAGAGGNDSLDWDRAAVLVEQKCAQR